MIKGCALIMIIIGSTLIGFLKANHFSEKKEFLTDYQQMLLHLSTEISYFKEPLPQIFYKLSLELQGTTQSFMKECFDQYIKDGGALSEIWNSTVEKIYGDKGMTTEELKIIKSPGLFLGQSDFDGQLKHFKLVSKELERKIEDADFQLKTKGKMYRKMGISLGIAISIIFI